MMREMVRRLFLLAGAAFFMAGLNATGRYVCLRIFSKQPYVFCDEVEVYAPGVQPKPWPVRPPVPPDLVGIVPNSTYIVDARHPCADDNNPGSADAPWKTLTHAGFAALSGCTILVKRGGSTSAPWWSLTPEMAPIIPSSSAPTRSARSSWMGRARARRTGWTVHTVHHVYPTHHGTFRKSSTTPGKSATDAMRWVWGESISLARSHAPESTPTLRAHPA